MLVANSRSAFRSPRGIWQSSRDWSLLGSSGLYRYSVNRPDVAVMSFVTSLKSGHLGGSGRAAAGAPGAVWAPAGTMAVAEMAPTAIASAQRAKRELLLRCISILRKKG